MVNTETHTVDELIEKWRNADLSISDGSVTATDMDEITVEYEGKDGILEVLYTLSDSAYRTDSNESFQIL